MDIFAGSDEVVVFGPVGPEDEDAAPDCPVQFLVLGEACV
jgi:hypothetical protein